LLRITTSGLSVGKWPVILVDTTVWIDLLRNRASARVSQLQELLELGEAATAPVIVQEVLQGAADRSAFARLRRYFSAIPLAGTSGVVELCVGAAELYARARWRAITPRSPNDCLIAAIAVAADLPLLHDDRDFERLAGVEPKLRLVP
jgi:predicted nucleic acid-binding protein